MNPFSRRRDNQPHRKHTPAAAVMIPASDYQAGMTLDELAAAVDQARQMGMPGTARVRADFPLVFDLQPGAPVGAVHFSVGEGRG